MKKYLTVIMFLTIAMLWGQNTSAQLGFSTSIQINDNAGSAITNEEQLEEIIENLNELQYNYLKKLSKKEYKESVMILAEIKRLLGVKHLAKEVETSVNIQEETSHNININMNIGGETIKTTQAAGVTTTTVVAPIVNIPMDAASFNRLLNQIEDEAFADDQMRYVRTATGKHYFSVAQVGQLIDIFAFSEEKIECLRVTYPKVSDKENGFNLIGRFTYADEKEEAEQIINQY